MIHALPATTAEPGSPGYLFDWYRGHGWSVEVAGGSVALAPSRGVCLLAVGWRRAPELITRLDEVRRPAAALLRYGEPDELVFVAARTGIPCPLPAGLRPVAGPVPLPPVPGVRWAVAPWDTRGLCRDIDIVHALGRSR
ncbi:hypothetical protein [Amycolatopsis aidingensis]|uniref:hypothetical protein n=1 Tax=Amycolatopsis aidingensis TaxID=2842453 RepID=UPI001C0D9970|nr:hypothetical protein [Amycolatopsis aidingensis]